MRDEKWKGPKWYLRAAKITARTHRVRRARKWWNIFVSNSTIRRERAKGIVCVWLYINLRCTGGDNLFGTCENGARLPDYHISTIKPANIVNFDTKALDKRLGAMKIDSASPNFMRPALFLLNMFHFGGEVERGKAHFEKKLLCIPHQCPSPSAMIFLRYATGLPPMHSTLHNSPKRWALCECGYKIKAPRRVFELQCL